MGCRHFLLYYTATFESVKHRHHDIAHNKVGHILGGKTHSFLSVGSGDDVIFIFHKLAYQLAYIAVVIDYKQQRLVGFRSDCLCIYHIKLGTYFRSVNQTIGHHRRHIEMTHGNRDDKLRAFSQFTLHRN